MPAHVWSLKQPLGVAGGGLMSQLSQGACVWPSHVSVSKCPFGTERVTVLTKGQCYQGSGA